MNCPSLVIREPTVSLVVEFLGVCFPVLGILLLSLLFYLPIMRLLGSMFLTLALAFTFLLEFTFSGRRGHEFLGNFEVVVFHFLNHRGKCNNMFLFWGHLVPLVVLTNYIKFVEDRSHQFVFGYVISAIILISLCIYVYEKFSV